MNGYILEHRKILNSPIWDKPPLYFKVWHYLLLKASFTDKGNLKRGQLFTSIAEIQTACSYYVGYRKEVPTKKQIYGILDWLRNPYEGDTKGYSEGNTIAPMIETAKVTHGLLVTICNYNVYQDPSEYESNSDRNDEADTNVTTKRLRRGDKGNNINNKDKELINNKEKENIKRKRNPLEDYPTSVQEAMAAYIDMRKKHKWDFGERAQLLFYKKLNELSGGDEQTMVDLIDQATLNNWRSVYPLRQDYMRNDSRSSGEKSYSELAAEMIARGEI